MLAWLQALVGIWPLVSKLIDLFKTTPEDQKAALLAQIQANLAAIHDAVKKAKDTGGDTSDIEKIIHGS
jgi:hypothetical protein